VTTPRVILCAVTDRRRLGSVTLVSQARAAADASLDFFQIREPDLPDAALLDLATRVRDATAGSTLRILINDRLDIALAAGLDGVHLRGMSYPAARARAMATAGGGGGGRPLLIGRSVHGIDEARAVEAAGGLDYLIFGTLFATASKPTDHVLAGVQTLDAAVRACRLPILAIGGITLDTAALVAQTGAAGLAAIGLFQDLGRMAANAAQLRRIFAAARPPA
jgi:thiamine-phosphate pyrophosphorylase